MKRFLIVAGLCAFALPALAQTTKFQGQLSGTQEVPAKQGNVCEGSGFLWLLPITLVMLGRRRLAGPAGAEALLAGCWLTATVGGWK